MSNRAARAARPALLAAGVLAVFAGTAHAGGWHSDFDAARAESMRLDLPLLVHFQADYCGPCKRLDREVLHSPDLTTRFGRSLVGVKINTQRSPEIAKRFGIESIPADVFLTPRGRSLGVMNGYQPKGAYIARVAAMERDYERLRALYVGYAGKEPPVRSDGPRLTLPPATATEVTPPVVSNTPAGPRVRPRENGVVLVGLKGFSPVTLHATRRWVPGDPRFAWEYQGLTYLMASAAELTQFQEDADRFAPRLLGCDPVLYYDGQGAVPGSPTYAAFFGEALYLFTSPQTRATFREQPERYTRRRTVLLLEELENRG